MRCRDARKGSIARSGDTITRGGSMRSRTSLLALGLVAIVIACGGETQSLGDVPPASSGSAGSAGSSTAPPGGSGTAPAGGNDQPLGSNAHYPNDSQCMTDCAAKAFRQSITTCKLCHYANMPNASPPMPSLGQLDLVSPNVEERLKDVPAKHVEIIAPNPVCPSGDKLIDSANPANSWLLKKLRGQQGSCGDKMPQTSTLTAFDQACLEDFVYCVAEL
jgi:hypothetical protein